MGMFRHLSLWCATVVTLAVETTLYYALHHDIGLWHQKEWVFGAIHNISIPLLQRLSGYYRKPRQSFSPSQFRPVVDIQSNISGKWLL
jgi:hypothetical protein